MKQTIQYTNNLNNSSNNNTLLYDSSTGEITYQLTSDLTEILYVLILEEGFSLDLPR